MRNISPKFDRDKFLINQRHLSLKGKYYVYDEEGRELFYVERPFGIFRRRNIYVFGGDSKTEQLLSITQDNYWEIVRRNYTVLDGDGLTIAKLSRNNFTSLFRRGWSIMGSEGTPVARAQENSLLLCALRRVIDLVPYVQLIGGIIKTDFHFLAPDSGGNERKIGAFNRRFSIFDKYVLDLSEDSQRTLDRRVALAMGILLDTGERR
jgi:uncharacterized protein YxjI